MKVSNTSERLKQIMTDRGLKQVDILERCEPYCRKYGIKLNKNDLSQYVSGKVVPKQDKLSILGMALGVSEVWLMGYDDDKMAVSDSSSGRFDNSASLLDDKERDLLDTFRILNDEGQRRVLERAHDLVDDGFVKGGMSSALDA